MTTEEWRDYCHDRRAWVAKGEPHDPTDPYWARVLERRARHQAQREEPRNR